MEKGLVYSSVNVLREGTKRTQFKPRWRVFTYPLLCGEAKTRRGDVEGFFFFVVERKSELAPPAIPRIRSAESFLYPDPLPRCQ